MPGTDLAHTAVSLRNARRCCGLRACYAVSGTEIAYAGPQHAVYTRAPGLGCRARGHLSPYAPATPCPILR
eukprot:1103442-Rhodomonas_salina.1